MLGGAVKYYRKGKRNHRAASAGGLGGLDGDLNEMVSGGLIEKLTPEQKPHRGQGVASADVRVQRVLGSGKVSAEVLEGGTCLAGPGRVRRPEEGTE